MTRSQANKIALELMKQHLEPGWFMNVGKVSLTMRGVQIKNTIADLLIVTWREAYRQGHKEGERL